MLQNVKNLNYEMHISKISSIIIPQCPQRMGSRTTPIPKPTDAQVPDIKWQEQSIVSPARPQAPRRCGARVINA